MLDVYSSDLCFNTDTSKLINLIIILQRLGLANFYIKKEVTSHQNQPTV